MLKYKFQYYSLKLAFVLFLLPFGLILVIAEMLTGVAISIENKLSVLAEKANIIHKPWFSRRKPKEKQV